MVRYLIWLVYTIMTGCLAVGVTSLLCIRAGMDAYWGIFFAALYAMAAAVGTGLLCRMMSGIASFIDRNRSLFVLLEATLAVTFAVVGFLFRIEGIENASEGENYFLLALEQEIPKIVHGAVYLYLQMLRGVFTLFGEHFAVGIWVQIILQMTASVILYFVVRRLAGAIAALISLGFCMCAPYMVGHALMLSPEMLYFCFLAAALAMIPAGYTGWRKLFLLFFTGIIIAILGYLDVTGLLLLIPVLGRVWCGREDRFSEKMRRALLCMTGLCVGFAGCISVDVFLSGAPIQKVARAWLLLYYPSDFQVPLVVEGMASDLEGIMLLGFMVFGIFSFWRDPEKERMTACIAAVSFVILAGCYGIFTPEMSGSFILYVLFAVLAGVGVGQCCYAASSPHTVDAMDDAGIQTLESGRSIEQSMEAGGYVEETGMEGGGSIEIWDGCLPEEAESDAEDAGNFLREKTVKYIENPLPLPKKHVKRVLEYTRTVPLEEEEFDHAVASDDDFDI